MRILIFTLLIFSQIGLAPLAAQDDGSLPTNTPCPFLGVMGADAPFAPSMYSRRIFSGEGALVISIIPSTAAESGGLKENDVIVTFGGEKVVGINHLQHLVRSHSPGDSVSIEFIRNGTPLNLRVEIGTNPESQRPCGVSQWATRREMRWSPGSVVEFDPDSILLGSRQIHLYRLSDTADLPRWLGRDSLRGSMMRLQDNIIKLDADLRLFDTCRLLAPSARKNGDTIFSRLFRRFEVIDRSGSGVHVQSVPDQLAEYFRVPDTHVGLLVTEVDPSSSMAQSGLQAGDILIELDGEKLTTPLAFIDKLLKGGDVERTLRIVRDGALVDIKIVGLQRGSDVLPIPEIPQFEPRRSDIY